LVHTTTTVLSRQADACHGAVSERFNYRYASHSTIITVQNPDPFTGGVSGMGLAIAEPLSRLGGWHIHLLDLNAERGE